MRGGCTCVRPTESGDVRLQTPPETGFQVMSDVRPVESGMSVSDMLARCHGDVRCQVMRP